MADYKPSIAARASTAARGGKAPKTSDIDLPSAPVNTDPRLIERPIGEYDKNRAKRVLSRPVFGGRR